MCTESIRILLIAPQTQWTNNVRAMLNEAQWAGRPLEIGLPSDTNENPSTDDRSRQDVLEAALILCPASPDGALELEWMESVRQMKPNTPLAVVLERWDEKTALKAIDLGVSECLGADSLSPKVLARSLRLAIGRRQAHESQRQVARQLAKDHRRLARHNRRLSDLCRTAHQFVDNVSHEFRTPLSVIKEYCSLIDDALAGPVSDRQREFLGIALARVEDLTMLVDDMLDASTMESGLLRVRRRRRQVGEMIKGVQKTMQRRLAQKKVFLQLHLAENLPAVFCDADKLSRVLLNLVVNALKFSPPDSVITVSATHQANRGEVRISVSDQGPGIPREQIGLLFERFRQLEGGARSPVKGFGLGLNIAQELALLNLGELSVESEVRKGSTFYFTTPTEEPEGLFRRYLARFGGGGEIPFVSLLEARLCEIPETAVVEETDEFLQANVRGEDLVYHTGRRRWVLALRCGGSDLSAIVERLQKAWRQTSFNRIAGPLPQLVLVPQGTWRADVQPTALCARFTAAALEQGAGHAPKVLLVDDDPEMIQALDLRMKAAGYNVMTAADGERGILAARDNRPDAIVLDAKSPGEDGIKTLTQLKSDTVTKDIPVVMLSASLADQHRAIEVGARFFLSKPFDASNVVSAVQSVTAPNR